MKDAVGVGAVGAVPTGGSTMAPFRLRGTMWTERGTKRPVLPAEGLCGVRLPHRNNISVISRVPTRRQEAGPPSLGEHVQSRVQG